MKDRNIEIHPNINYQTLPFSSYYPKLQLYVFPTIRRRDKYGNIGGIKDIKIGQPNNRTHIGYSQIIEKHTVTLEEIDPRLLMYDTDSDSFDEAVKSINRFYRDPIEMDETLYMWWNRWIERDNDKLNSLKQEKTMVGKAIIVKNQGSVYHLVDRYENPLCQQIGPSKETTTINIDTAKETGYRICKNCKKRQNNETIPMILEDIETHTDLNLLCDTPVRKKDLQKIRDYIKTQKNNDRQ